jgi:plastocyanin
MSNIPVKPDPAQKSQEAKPATAAVAPNSHEIIESPKSKTGLIPKLLVAAAVIFLVLIIIFAFTRPKTKVSTNQNNVQLQPAAVSVTKNGFVPATLQIKIGTQVNWKNNDTKIHQIAADPYPKNNSIPGFDSQVILKSKDTYSFTFTKTGIYTYHDEHNPLKSNFKGTITVK